MNTKFLEYAVDILREEESVYVIKREKIVEELTEDNNTNNEADEKKGKKSTNEKGNKN